MGKKGAAGYFLGLNLWGTRGGREALDSSQRFGYIVLVQDKPWGTPSASKQFRGRGKVLSPAVMCGLAHLQRKSLRELQNIMLNGRGDKWKRFSCAGG